MNNSGTDIPERYLFGDWLFDAATGDLQDGEKSTRLEPQVAKLLDYFLTHQGALISRDELIDSVWDSRIVTDDAINRCVSILRQVLSPDDKNAYIETVVRKGFLSHFPPPPAQTPRATRRTTFLAMLAIAGLAAVVLYALAGRFDEAPNGAGNTQGSEPPMVAVLPFTFSGTAEDNEFFANGMHDDLLTQLAQLQSIRVISRTSVLEYRNSQQSIREIGLELGADAVLEGGIQRIGDQVRINAQLIDAKSDAHRWAGQYDRKLIPANIFEVQSEIALAIAEELNASVTEQDAVQLRVLPTQNMAAYRAYHRALEIRDIFSVDHPEYIRFLEEAVTLDPSFTRAWAELAGYLSFQMFSREIPDVIQRVEQILEKIHRLEPESANYLIAQAFYAYYILKNYDLAYQLIVQAQVLRPSDERLFELKSNIQRRQGDFDGKIESTRMARKLDPRNPLWTVSLVKNLMITHQYDKASLELDGTVKRDFDLAELNSRLRMREHRDAGRWARELLMLQKEFERTSISVDMWDSHIALRDFEMAKKLVSEMQEFGDHGYRYSISELSGVDLYQLITYCFLQANDQLDPFLVQVRAQLDARQTSDGEHLSDTRTLIHAFVAVAEGDTEEAERLVRVWQRVTSDDLAHLANLWHLSCRALGMAAATKAAVDCIRNGLEKPSYVMPFLEPFLPYYDSIRDEPDFVELLADIEAQRI